MSCNLITISGGRKFARPIVSREEYMRLRGSATNVERLKAARKGDKKAKLRLLQFNYSGYYPNGKVAGNALPSRAFMLDIDDRQTFERVAEELLKDPKGNALLMLERSVNGGGHAVFVREVGKTILENQVERSLRYGCEMDCNAHDVNRVAFTTSADAEDLLYVDDDLFADVYNEEWAKAEAQRLKDREANGEEDLPAGAHRSNKHYKPWEEEHAVAFPVAEAEAQPAGTKGEGAAAFPTEYNGIAYAEIIDTYWKLHNGGRTPEKGNRNTLVYELAYDLRHICGHNPQWLNAVIPDYGADDADDPFTPQEKMAAITNGVNAKKTSMTKKLRAVLDDIKQTHNFSPEVIAALDEADELDSTFFASQLPALPMGLRESAMAVGSQLTMPILFACFPAIGALATRVRINVHGTYNTLNLIAYICGDFASGKGSIDPVVNQWMEEVKDQDRMYLEVEKEWRSRSRQNKNAKKQEEEPRNPIRYITLNNTVANLCDRLAKCDGLHAFSFTPEADTLATKWRTGMTDFSVMLRQAYDGSSYEREAKSVDAVNVHIDRLLWNVTMCGTPDALFRVVSNYTDGFLSRIAIARTPDNTFAALPKNPYTLTEELKQKIQLVAHFLPLLSGDLELAKLEEVGREWLDKIRIETIKDNDAVTARARIRSCISAQRMTACVILCATIEELLKKRTFSQLENELRAKPAMWVETAERMGRRDDVLGCFAVFAEYMMENAMAYFHDKIEEAMENKDYAGRRKYRTRNRNAFECLPERFTSLEAYAILRQMKGTELTERKLKRILGAWYTQGLVTRDGSGYVKAG